MIYERMAETGSTVDFPLVVFSLTSFHNSLTTSLFAAGDFRISKDYGDFTNTATLPASCPGGQSVVLSLSSAEMTARHIHIQIKDQTATKVWEDQAVLIETYGTTTAQHAFNRNSFTVQASLTAAQTGVTIATVTQVTNQVVASLTANQAGVTIATVTNVTNGVNITSSAFPLQASLTANNAVVVSSMTSTMFPLQASLTANNAVVVSSITSTAFPFAASLTAAQTGVTIATVTNVTNGVNLTTTAILNNLAASATAQINAEVDTALADASVTAVAMNKIHSATDAANAVFAATLTSSSFNADTGGQRLSFLDRAISSVTAAINSSDVAVAVWGANPSSFTTADTFGRYIDKAVSSITASINSTDVAAAVWGATQSAYDVAGTFGGHLDATVSGISVSGSGDWTDAERAYIRYTLGVPGSTTAGSTGPIYSISSAVSSISAAISSISAAVSSMSAAWASNTTLLNSISAAVASISSAVTSRLDAAITTRSIFDPSTTPVTLTANQTGVTIATVTNVTNGVNITTTAIVNNLAASATAQILAQVSAGLAAASVTANVMNTVITNLDAAVSTRSTFNPSATGVTLTAAQTGVTIANVTTVNNLGSSATSQVNAEIVDALVTDTYSEPLGVVAATASLKDKISWMVTLARNKITQTATLQTLRNDADAADIATSTHSDDGTTHVRNEWT